MSLLIIPWLALSGATDPTSSVAGGLAEPTELDEGSLAAAGSTLQDLAAELGIGALLRTSFDVSSGEAYETLDGNGDAQDATGVRFEDAQVWLDTHAGPFEVFFLGKAADANAFPAPTLSNGGLGSFDLFDAWIRTELAEGVDLYGGQFKCPLVGSGMVGYDSLIMIDRTRIGQLFSAAGAYQPGVALTFDNETFHGKLAVQNGADSIIDEHGLVARGEFKVNGGARHREGALGAPEGLAATFGAGYFSDGSQIGGDDFGSAVAVDAYATFDGLSFFGEVLDADEELAAKALGNTSGDEGTPFSATLGYLFGDSRWEAALRYQDMDDDLDTTLVGAGINHYQGGHGLKYQLNVSDFDNDAVDGTIVQFGVTLGLGAPNSGCATCRG